MDFLVALVVLVVVISVLTFWETHRDIKEFDREMEEKRIKEEQAKVTDEKLKENISQVLYEKINEHFKDNRNIVIDDYGNGKKVVAINESDVFGYLEFEPRGVGIVLKMENEEVIDYRPVLFWDQREETDNYLYKFWDTSMEYCEYFEESGEPLTLNQKNELVSIYDAVKKRAELEDVHNW